MPEQIETSYSRVLTLPPYSAVTANVTAAAAVVNVVMKNAGGIVYQTVSDIQPGILKITAQIDGALNDTDERGAICALYAGEQLVSVTQKFFTMQSDEFDIILDDMDVPVNVDELRIFLWDDNMNPQGSPSFKLKTEGD